MATAYLDGNTIRFLLDGKYFDQLKADAAKQGIEFATTREVLAEVGRGTGLSDEVTRFLNNADQHIKVLPNPSLSDVPKGNGRDYGERTLAHYAQQDISAGRTAEVVTQDARAPSQLRKPVTQGGYGNDLPVSSIGIVPRTGVDPTGQNRPIPQFEHSVYPNDPVGRANLRDALTDPASLKPRDSGGATFPNNATEGVETYTRPHPDGGRPEQVNRKLGEGPPDGGRWTSGENARAMRPDIDGPMTEAQRVHEENVRRITNDPASFSPDGELTPEARGGLDKSLKALGAIGLALAAYDAVTTGKKIGDLINEGRNAEALEEAGGLAGRIFGGIWGFALGASLGVALGPLGLLGSVILASIAGTIVGDQLARDAANWLSDLFGPYILRRDPLVFDLNGDGVSLSVLGAPDIYFDLNGDGFAERTGWVNSGDALLVLDINSNGLIDNGTELFGTSTRNGFEALSDYDLDHDGIINAVDPVFTNLKFWRDSNQDGVSQANELQSVAGQIASINLLSNDPIWWATSRGGNSVIKTGNFTWLGGSSGEVIAVAFATDQINTKFLLPPEFAYSPEVYALPNLRGYGQLPDLWVAMSLDPTLLQMVKDLLAGASGAIDELSDLIGKVETHELVYAANGVTVVIDALYYRASAFENILARWAGVGFDLDGNDGLQLQATVEALINRQFLPEARLTTSSVEAVTNPRYFDTYQQFSRELATRFATSWADIEANRPTLDLLVGLLNASSGGTIDPALSSGLIVQARAGIENPAPLGAFLQSFLPLNHNFAADRLGGDVATFIDLQLTSWQFNPADPWAGYDAWLNPATDLQSTRAHLLQMVDPGGVVLDERIRVHSGNQSLTVLRAAHSDVVGDGAANNLAGTTGVDVIKGLAGNDTLAGGAGDDTYVFADGFGNDVIVDASGAADEISFQQTRTSERARFAFAGGGRTDLLISFSDAPDTVLVQNFFDVSGNPNIERISFADGLSRSIRSIRDEVMRALATANDDVITAFAAGSDIEGHAGNDTLFGSTFGETIDGGTGNDRLEGYSGNDIYRFARGDGTDTVSDSGAYSYFYNAALDGGIDRVDFAGGIAPSDIDVLQQGGTDLILKVRGTTDQIILKNALSEASYRIEEVRFAGGTVWNHTDLVARSTVPTVGDDVFYAGSLATTLSGGSGNDTLYGSANGDDILYGDAGNDVLHGNAGGDILTGGAGADQLFGYTGNDIYRFARGDGADAISDSGGYSYFNNAFADGGVDRLEFAAGIAPGDVDVVQQGGIDLILKVRGATDQIILRNALSDAAYRIEEVRFADASGIVWNHAELVARSVTPTDGDDDFSGGSLALSLFGGAGNDTLRGGGNGNNNLDGGSGNDALFGNTGADIFVGGTGNDQLEGSSGNDIYRFARGDGADAITDRGYYSYFNNAFADGGADRIEFAASIAPGDIDVVQQGGTDLILKVRGTTDQIILRNALSDTAHRIEEVRFAGSNVPVWTHADLVSRIIPDNRPPVFGNEIISNSVYSEAAAAGELYAVTATDPDGNSLTYSLSGADASVLAINPITGVLNFVIAPDFEAPRSALNSNTYSISVIASDAQYSAVLAVTIRITNTNEAISITSLGGGADGTISVAEGSFSIGTVTAADLDGDVPAYSITGGADGSRFVIDALSGNLKFAVAANFEIPTDVGGDNVYDVIVSVTDGVLSDSQSISVAVTNVNEGLAITSNGGGDNSAVSSDENGFNVTTVVANDIDGDSVSYSISGGTDASKFTINAVTGVLQFVVAPNFEAPTDAGGNNVFDVIVAASDGVFTDAQALAVTVANIDETVIITSNGAGATSNLSTSENGVAVTSVAAVDPDGGVISYGLAGGADASKFTINATTGVLQFIAAPNYEAPSDAGANNIYDVIVSATDANSTDIQAIAVTVTNVNEPVTLTSNGAGDSAAILLNENVSAVSTITGIDTDGGAVSYSIAGGADAAKFTINATTGVLQFVVAPNYEVPTDVGANNVYDVIVAATDGVFTDTQAVAVTVNNIIDGATVAGTSGNDTVSNVAALVQFRSTNAEDTINSLAGIDTISGGGGDDVINAGDGNDTVQYSGSAEGFDRVDGGLGTDTVVALSNNSVIGLASITGVEAISAGNFTGVSISGSAAADTLNFAAVTLTGIARIDGGAGNDTITGSAAAATITGGAGDDTLTGGAGADTFLISGTGDGFDAIVGGAGTDTIRASANNTVIGLRSIATIEAISAGGFTGVSISGTTAADTLNFSAVTLTGITKIDGGAGNDTITGSSVAATITGGAGDDTLTGGGGADTFLVSGTGDGFDTVVGGAGIDTISATASNTVIGLRSIATIEAISAGSFTGVSLSGTTAADTLNFSAVTLTGIGQIDGGAGNDIITGSAGADVLIGGLGNDTLTGGAGTDTVDYSYSATNWTINLAATSAQAVSGTETDTIATIENVIGGSGNDSITGTTAANNLKGGAGADRITGGLGNDALDGGQGIDVAVFAGLQASYSLTTNNGVVTVIDNQSTVDGNDGTDTLIGTEKVEFKGGVQVALAAPIVLDLNGDGVTLVNRTQSSALFDWDGDGARDRTGWVGSDDGILFFDRDGNGTVTGADELSFVNDKAGAKSDLDGLTAFDSNSDGLFSQADTKWTSFNVWQDRNSDGVADASELRSLSAAGISAINLNGQAVNRSWNWGDNLTLNTGQFTRTDGGSGKLADVALSYQAPTTAKALNLGALLTVAHGTDIFDYYGGQSSNSDLNAPSATAPAPAPARQSAPHDLRVNLMRQDMASFGVRHGEGSFGSPRESHQARYEYFA